MSKRVIELLIIVTLLGGFFRLYKIADNPPSLNGDEIAFGYSAYSILKTGHDEYGVFLPLTFKSVGDYKNPVPVYLMVPSIAIFGLNDFAVRFPNALISTLTIPLFFFFLKDIFKNPKLALLGAFLLSISSWHIFYSRYSYETLMSSTFVMLGIWLFIKMLKGGMIWAILSALFFILAMYTSFTTRLFVPVFVVIALLVNYKTFLKTKKKAGIFIGSCLILILPLLYVSFFQGASTRLSMVLLSNDIEFSRYILFHGVQSILDWPIVILFWVRRYLSYFNPNFIFLNGLGMTQSGSPGLGLLYPYELPFLIWGVVDFIKRKVPAKSIFVVWFFTGLIPDSLTNNQQNSGRLLQILPLVILFATLGFNQFLIYLNKFTLKTKLAALTGLAAIIILVWMHAFLTFAIHFPYDQGETFGVGLREMAQYVIGHQNEYNKIVIDPRRGVDGPYIITNPYLDILFYSAYDPQKYQTEAKSFGEKDHPNYQFDKYEFRYIDWHSDNSQKGILFVGSPWAFPKEGMHPGEILQKIYLINGAEAFYVVAPK